MGDTIVYAAQGIGRVVAREQANVAGAAREFLVVELVNGLRVTLPVEEAPTRLRAVADEAELEEVERVLAAAPAEREAAWQKRLQGIKEKLGTGHAPELAELVRDGAILELSARAPRLSHSERSLYLHARQLLAREIAWVRGLEVEQVEEWIDAQIRTSKAFEPSP